MAKHILLRNGQSYGITTDMTGKMEGMNSLNTSPEVNPFCQRMRDTVDTICTSCYTRSSENRWKHCHTMWANNYKVLTENLLKDAEIPYLNFAIFRFQAHGDLGNRTHYKNLIRIAEANPQTTFALWTKRLDVINRGGLIKRKNLIYVYSTPRLNELQVERPEGFQRVFSVFSRPFIREHKKITINCGKKQCADCKLCYTRSNRSVYVNELIKSNGHILL
jgi:hypothetical protein